MNITQNIWFESNESQLINPDKFNGIVVCQREIGEDYTEISFKDTRSHREQFPWDFFVYKNTESDEINNNNNNNNTSQTKKKYSKLSETENITIKIPNLNQLTSVPITEQNMTMTFPLTAQDISVTLPETLDEVKIKYLETEKDIQITFLKELKKIAFKDFFISMACDSEYFKTRNLTIIPADPYYRESELVQEASVKMLNKILQNLSGTLATLQHPNKSVQNMVVRTT